jgi:hypothetical protein
MQFAFTAPGQRGFDRLELGVELLSDPSEPRFLYRSFAQLLRLPIATRHDPAHEFVE